MKTLFWVGSSRKDIGAMPDPVQSDFGFALYQAQNGDKSYHAKPLHGFGGAGVLEVVENYDGNTYRAVYTVKFAEVIYVLHVFQKKSNMGKATPQHDIDLVKSRLKVAAEHYEKWEKNQKEL